MIFMSRFSRNAASGRKARNPQSIKEQHVAVPLSRRLVMTWETPAYCEIRLGFEVTAYVYVR